MMVPAKAAPSWLRVIGTTLRLWLQRRVLHRVPRWRAMSPAQRRLTGVIAAVVVLFAAGLIGALANSRSGGQPGGRLGGGRLGGGGNAAGSPAALAAAAVSRRQAAAWVAAQVARSAIVGCDAVMCAALTSAGFPASSLLTLSPAATDPMGTTVVISTTAVRSQFGSKLAEVYAPAVLASFGAGSATVQVRVIAPDGAAAYRRALAADLSARRADAAQLLRSRKVQLAGPQRGQLASGQVDSRLLATLVELASAHYRVRVLSFGGAQPGATAGIPLRYAEVALRGARGQPRGKQLLPAAIKFLDSQIPPYRPASMQPARGAGQPVLRIDFSAPSPLNLLTQLSPK